MIEEKQPGERPRADDGPAAPSVPSPRLQAGDLRRRSVRSGAVTVASQLTQFGMQTVSTVVLARLLTPRDFGITAMVLTVTNFARIFKDLGLSAATIQHAGITRAQINTLFWVNVLVGSVLTLAVAATAPALVWFYQKPEVFWVAIALSATFVISSVGIQHSALLNRDMRFRALALAQVLSGAVGFVSSIAAAVFGLGYWALVLGPGVTAIASTVLLWTYSDWRPESPARRGDVGKLFRFGADVTGFEIANYFARNLDSVLVGRFWGAPALGLYSRANALLMVPINNLRSPLNAVAFPALSHLQADRERYRAYYRKYSGLLAFASMPLATFLFVCADNAVGLLLGSRWTGVISIFEILAVVAFLQPVTSTQGLVMLSSGLSRRYLWIGLANAVIMSTAFGIGVFWGPTGVAAAYAISFYLAVYPNVYFSLKGTAVGVGEFFGSLVKAGVASVVGGAAAFALKLAIGPHHDLLVLLACGAGFAAAYLAVFALLPGGRGELREYLSHVRLIFAPRPAGGTGPSPL